MVIAVGNVVPSARVFVAEIAAVAGKDTTLCAIIGGHRRGAYGDDQRCRGIGIMLFTKAYLLSRKGEFNDAQTDPVGPTGTTFVDPSDALRNAKK